MPAWVASSADFLANIATIFAAFGVLIALWRVSHDIRTRNQQSFFYLHQYLSQDGFSVARRELRERLREIDYEDWTEDDKASANRVCASYDQAGILITGGIVDSQSAEVFLRSSWGESICHQYEALSDYLDDDRVKRGVSAIRGRDFFVHFGDLYKISCRFHRKSRRAGVVAPRRKKQTASLRP